MGGIPRCYLGIQYCTRLFLSPDAVSNIEAYKQLRKTHFACNFCPQD